MSELEDIVLACPAGIDACPVTAEAKRLKEQCDQLSEQSQVDPLTGLFNFYYLMQALELELERTRRTAMPTGLIMLDMDHFKSINDLYGHQSGNEALRWTSQILRTRIRLIDIPCRYGGEEFTLILPGTSLPHAVRTAERLRRTMEENPLHLNGVSLKLTASFGVEVYKSGQVLTPNEFIERADRFLLQAKMQGRNRVCYEENVPAPAPSGVTTDERAALFITRWPKH